MNIIVVLTSQTVFINFTTYEYKVMLERVLIGLPRVHAFMSDRVWLNVLLQSSGFMLLLPY